MNISINQISNPGISLTDDLNRKLIDMFNLIKNKNEKITYQEFQELLISAGIFAGSYIRSAIPFLSDLGIITEYKIVDTKNFFTPLGISYIKIIESLQMVKETDSIYNNLMEIKSDLIGLMLLFMKNSNSKYIQEYINMIKYIEINGTLSKEEYYLCKYCTENHISNINEIIDSYRNDSIAYNIKIVGKDGTLNDISSNNAYQYIYGLLSEKQANYIIKSEQSIIKLNQNRKKFYEDLVKE